MSSSYKIALIAAVAVFGFVVFYYATQDGEQAEVADSQQVAAQDVAEDSQASTPLIGTRTLNRTTPRAEEATTSQPAATERSRQDDEQRQRQADLMASIRANMAASDQQAASSSQPAQPQRETPTLTFDRTPTLTSSDEQDTASTPTQQAEESATSTQTQQQQQAQQPAPVQQQTTRTTPRERETTSPATTAAQTQSEQRRTYTIRTGDTFSSIAQSQLGDERKWTLIAEANPLVDPTRLKVGEEIHLPTQREVAANQSPTVRDMPRPEGTRTHTVRTGETLASISQQYYDSEAHWRVIYDANRSVIGDNPNRIRVGMELNIPPSVVLNR